jgi:inhibitor of cysteine peptidase
MPSLITPIALLLLITACAATPPGPPAVENGELTNAADGTRIAIKRGGELKVILDASITTGFQWQSPTNPAPVMSAIGTPIYVAKAADPRFVGGGGMNIFRFRAEAPGQIALQFEYRRSWETTVPPAKTLRYDVVVQ